MQGQGQGQSQQNPYFYQQPISGGSIPSSSMMGMNNNNNNNVNSFGAPNQPPSSMGQGQPDFFQFQNVYQNVSPEMINTGLNVGKNLIQSEWDKRMTGVSSFWLTLKIYFAVSCVLS